MRLHCLVTIATALIVTCFLSPVPVHAAGNLLFILDSSGSMWGQLEGTTKMETAKAALSKLVGDLPENTKVGLMAYGHRLKRSEPNACDDIELLMPVGTADPDGLVGRLERISPKGRTPIAGSLLRSPTAFAGLEGTNNDIVLISDGIETCDGDPCAVAGDLAASNINVRVHVVGFDVSEQDRAQLECIAELGKGKYYSANSTAGLAAAVAEAVQVAQRDSEPEPPPEPPEPTIHFQDDFDGEELAEHWEVLNPNPDAFIVENGRLLVINSVESALPNENVENLFRLVEPMPNGDWMMTLRLQADFQTSKEQILFGLYDDAENYIVTYLSVPGLFDWVAGVRLQVTKRSSGEPVNFSKEIWNGGRPNGDYSAAAASVPQPIQIRLNKTGRTYTAAAMVEGQQWVELDKVTSLRAKGNLVVGVRQYEPFSGETLAHIDWVKVEAIE